MKNKLNWLEWSLLALPFVILAFSWPGIPDRVPIHWDLTGRIDRYAPKAFGMFLIPLLALSTVVLLRFSPRLDPKLRKEGAPSGRMGDALRLFRLVLAGFFCVVFLVAFDAARGGDVSVGRVMPSCLLLLLAVLGNYLALVRPNYFVGICTPWTLENPDTWRATHRLGGRLIFFGSLLLLVFKFFINEHAFTLLMTSAAVLLAV